MTPENPASRHEAAQTSLDPPEVVGLRVDYRDQPLGLENAHPRLSWRVKSDRRGVCLTAYRILVASSEAALSSGNGDLWDSGKVESRSSLDVEYAGRPLASRERCWWSVQIWDERAIASRPSSPAWWEMGLLTPADWSAQWLAAEDRIAREDREAGLDWIWGNAAPPELPTHRFRFAFELPEAATRGALAVAVKQHYLWSQITRIWLDGVALAGPGRWIASRSPFDAPPGTTITNLVGQQLALESLDRGRHVLAVEVGTRPVSSWSFASEGTPPNVPGLAALCRLELANGRTVRLRSGTNWKTHSGGELSQEWYQPDFDDKRWTSALSDPAERYQPWAAQPAMHLRRTFEVSREITHARLYVTALGAYEARLNGVKVGDAQLTPGPSQYDRRVLYQTYDVQSLIQPGQNSIGLTVADGWYASYEGRFAFGPPPRRVIAQLELTYDDGSQQTIATGPGWRIAESAIRSSQLKIGEVQDARLDPLNWDRPEFDDARWQGAQVAEPPPGQLTAQHAPSIRITRKLKAQAITQHPCGDHIIDFGVCFGGWCEIAVTGAAGAGIELRYAERLGPSGEVDQTVMSQDPCGEPRRDVFFLRGDPAGERLASRFVHRGFRFVQVSGLDARPDVEAVEGAFVHSDLEVTGAIYSDNKIIEDIFGLILQTQESNFVGIPVDNNTREVRGYNGEMAIFAETACFNMDVSTFFRHHMRNTVDVQQEDGVLPMYAPYPRHTTVMPQPPGEAPGWGDTLIWMIWQCWRHYDDTASIARYWEAMNRWLQFIYENNPEHVWIHKRGFDFGDWLSLEPTPKDLFATAIWAHTVALLAQMAEALGRSDDVKRLLALRARIQKAFNVAFVKADGTIGNGSQTSYILPVAFDLLDNESRSKAVTRLCEAIRKRSPSGLTTGTWGTRYLLDVLADNGRADLAYDLLTCTQFPSWGHMMRNGATALWEHWDGKAGTWNQPGLGTIGGFLFRRVAGIEAAAPGFAKIICRPLADPRLQAAGGRYRSAMGFIATDWKRSDDGAFHLDLLIPANARAQVHLPTGDPKLIQESGKSILSRTDIRIVSLATDETTIAIGSGRFRFAATTGEYQ